MTTQLNPQGATPIEMTYSEILEYRERLLTYTEEIEAAMAMIKEELLNRLKKDNLNSKVVGEYSITRVKKIKFEVSKKEAEDLAATKTTITIDTAKLKKLMSAGVDIKHSFIEYPIVKKLDFGMED